jgi:uncharacterized YigZ family protein
MSTPEDIGDTFRTVADAVDVSCLVLGSKFIAHLAPTCSLSEVEAVLRQRQRRYPDATHHCWACRVGRPAPLIEKSADAGEPSGTAGRPILDALRGATLENVACIVTRYFGGTKLGTGGLVRAYAGAANEAIGTATLVSRTVAQKVFIDFEHERTGALYRALDELGLHLADIAYNARGHGSARVPLSKVAVLLSRLQGLAPGGVDVRLGEREIV